MKDDILVALYSEDSYVLDWMSLLIVRDWRTRVVLEATSEIELSREMNTGFQKIDVLVIDLDAIENLKSVVGFMEEYNKKTGKLVKVIGLSRKPSSEFFKVIPSSFIRGFVFKQEILTSLGWAITFASEGTLIFTPGAIESAYQSNFQVPKNHLVLRSRSYPGLTERQSEIARLAIIFSIGRRDLADELKISDQWSYGIVSELYAQLGLGDILDENQQFNSILENDPVIKVHIDEIIKDLGESKKARDLETLAFHLLTMPVIE